jgi:hypothetical protein
MATFLTKVEGNWVITPTLLGTMKLLQLRLLLEGTAGRALSMRELCQEQGVARQVGLALWAVRDMCMLLGVFNIDEYLLKEDAQVRWHDLLNVLRSSMSRHDTAPFAESRNKGAFQMTYRVAWSKINPCNLPQDRTSKTPSQMIVSFASPVLFSFFCR